MELYTGDSIEHSFSPQSVVKRLIKPIDKSMRNITMGNYYTSVALAKDLLSNHKLTMVGTLRADLTEIPREFLSRLDRIQYSSLFGFSDSCTMVSYASKTQHSMILLSTMHHSDKIDPNSGESQTPEILTFYNLSRSGVDTAESLCEMYRCGRRTRRWPAAVFFRLLDIATFNSCILYNTGKATAEMGKLNRRNFMKILANELAREHNLRRSEMKHLPRPLKQSLKRKLGLEEEGKSAEEKLTVSGKKKCGRCYICPRVSDKKCRTSCDGCGNLVCKGHQKILCYKCFD